MTDAGRGLHEPSRRRSGARWLAALAALAVLAAACSGGGGPELEADGNLAEEGVPILPIGETPDDEAVVVEPEVVDPNAVRIGVILDASNVLAAFDRQPGIAFTAAIDEVNLNGGVLGRPVAVVTADAESRMSKVDEAARRMIEGGAVMLVVTCELDFASVAVSRAEEAGVLVLSPCAGEEDWGSGEVGDLAFSLVAPSSSYGSDMAELLWSEGNEEAVVLWDATSPEPADECDGFRRRWRQLGGRVSAEKDLTIASADSLDADTELVESMGATDVVVLCSYNRVGLIALERIRDAGVATPIFGGLSMDSPQFRPTDVIGLGDYRVLSFASAHGDDPAEAVVTATDAYRSADGVAPGSGRFVLGVDLASVWVAAVEDAGTFDAAAVAEAMLEAEELPAASGPVRFDGTHVPTDRVLRVLVNNQGVLAFDRLWGDLN